MKKEEGFGGGSSMMQDLFGSVRRSLHFRPKLDSDESANASSSVAERIGSCIRKSRVGLGGLLPKSPSRRLTMGFGFEKIGTVKEEEVPQIRWRKGELIGAGAYGQVFMGMNLDSGELLAVKQVVIGNTDASKEKAQAHIKELEEEVKLLKNLSHPNIVRYLGTVREEGTLNILLEFVPGGSISSLLSKFGSFPETVIRMYTKQILQGLEYLHQNKIIHRDIKGANILVDNKGCIKLADFGASKKVAQLATMAAAKSFKGTPYWMAPEVIVQSGHSFSADIWSVGCTVIEMATGKPPWSGQYQEVAAIFHVGTTKSHPPIPDHLSSEARDFLLKCLQEDACLRPSAYDLLQHPFVSGELKAGQSLNRAVSKESSNDVLGTNKTQTSNFGTITRSAIVPEWDAGTDDDMCRLDDEDDFPIVGTECFNPMPEPFDEWPSIKEGQNGNFPSESATCEEEEEVTENNIKAFLDAKALDLTKLCEELFNSIKSTNARVVVTACKENTANEIGFILPRSGSSRIGNPSPGFSSRRVSHGIGGSTRVLKEIDVVQKPPTFSKIHEAWREELVQEMDMHREILGLAPPSRMTSPKDSPLNHKRNRPIIINNNK